MESYLKKRVGYARVITCNRYMDFVVSGNSKIVINGLLRIRNKKWRYRYVDERYGKNETNLR